MSHKVPLPTQRAANMLPHVRATTTRSEKGTIVRLERQPETLNRLGGSECQSFNETLLTATLHCMWFSPDEGALERRIAAGQAALGAFKPTDEIEAMIAAQAVAMHHAAMECCRRAMLPDQHPEVASKLRRDGANMSRAMTDMVEALNRKRGKGPQIVRVERVMVADGGQAIVGAVTASVGASGGREGK